MRYAFIEGQLGPRLPPIGRLPEAAPPAPRREAPGQPLHSPHRRIEISRIGRVDRDVDRAGRVVDEQHLLPIAAAVPRAEHATRWIGAGAMPHRRDVYDVRVAWIDDDAGDVPCVIESQMCPGATAIRRAVDAVTVSVVLSKVRLSAARVDDVRITRGDGNRANRRDVRLAVGDVGPSHAGVRRLPHPAVDGTEVEDPRIARIAGDGNRASATERADESPSQPAQLGGGALIAGRVGNRIRRRLRLGVRREGNNQAENE